MMMKFETLMSKIVHSLAEHFACVTGRYSQFSHIDLHDNNLKNMRGYFADVLHCMQSPMTCLLIMSKCKINSKKLV